MIETIKIIIEIGSILLSLKNQFSNSERKKQIADWLYQLGDNIETLAFHFEVNQYPTSTCARMTESHDNLDEIIGNAIVKEKKEKIKDLIGRCLNIEKTFYEYINLEELDKIKCVQDLYSISGSILGIADTLKFQK